MILNLNSHTKPHSNIMQFLLLWHIMKRTVMMRAITYADFTKKQTFILNKATH